MEIGGVTSALGDERVRQEQALVMRLNDWRHAGVRVSYERRG